MTNRQIVRVPNAAVVVLGIDYGIFLFGRIKEEVAKYGIREGVHIAVACTGAIIPSPC